MIRSDERLEDLPMTPVECQRCHATVGVRKSSWQQTSVQWDADAARTCPERRSSLTGGGLREADFFTCAGLRESIAQAALSGAIPMPEGSVPRDVPREVAPGVVPRSSSGGPAGAAAEERAVRQ